MPKALSLARSTNHQPRSIASHHLVLGTLADEGYLLATDIDHISPSPRRMFRSSLLLLATSTREAWDAAVGVTNRMLSKLLTICLIGLFTECSVIVCSTSLSAQPAATGSPGPSDAPLTPAQLKQLEDRCKAGERDYCFTLGSLYENGAAIPKDLTRAQSLFEAACLNNLREACSAAASLYWRKEPPAKKEARQYYSKACDLGDGEGCFSLALGEDMSNAMALNSTTNVDLLVKACNELRYGAACMALGKLSVAKHDDLGSVAAYRSACEYQNYAGCYELSLLYESGVGVAKDLGEANRLQRLACEGHFPSRDCEKFQIK
jgi:hypothetical protein